METLIEEFRENITNLYHKNAIKQEKKDINNEEYFNNELRISKEEQKKIA